MGCLSAVLNLLVFQLHKPAIDPKWVLRVASVYCFGNFCSLCWQSDKKAILFDNRKTFYSSVRIFSVCIFMCQPSSTCLLSVILFLKIHESQNDLFFVKAKF